MATKPNPSRFTLEAIQAANRISGDRPLFHASLEIKPFENRGLSKRTVQACAECGIDFPERLLFMNENDLKKIPGVGNASLAELKAYRAKFLG